MPTFVLNDETKINSYGFRIPNKGINLERFKSNPVMLDEHWNSTRAVLGRWKNLRIEGSKLLADSEFDVADKEAKRVAGKVDREFIKGCSMGVTFNRAYMELMPDDTYVLTKCELFEASICAIPSNANSISLFTEGGELITDEQVQLSLSALKTELNKNPNTPPKMEKIILSAAAVVALGLTVAPETNEALELAIKGLSAKYEQEKLAKNALQAKLDEQVKLQANALVDAAVLAGKITADAKEQFVEMATANYELASKVIGAMPAKTNLSSKVETPAGGKSEGPKNIDEFEKLSVAEQLAFKKDNPEAYAKLFA